MTMAWKKVVVLVVVETVVEVVVKAVEVVVVEMTEEAPMGIPKSVNERISRRRHFPLRRHFST